MKRVLGIAAVTAFAVVGIAGPASADPKGNQNCFGQDRAAYIAQQHAAGDPNVQGDASSTRKGDNSTINADYKDSPSCGTIANP